MVSMKIFSCAAAGLVALAGVVNAHPIARAHPEAHPCPLGSEELHKRHSKRQDGSPGLTDLDILQFALTLEHLEAAFYQEGFSRFPASDFQALGLDSDTIAGLTKIGETEATHVTALMAAIQGAGATPVPPCTYNFGMTDAASMVAIAKILEAVGVSAYLGAAPLVTDPAVLIAAASIVTVEARHQTFIRTALGESPVPQAFDVAVGARQVFTLASSFITSCPPEANLNIQPFPSLIIQDANTVTAGSTLTLADPSVAADGTTFCAFTGGESATQFAPLQGGSCVVPAGLTGETYIVLSSDGASITDDKVVAGPAVLVF